MTNENNVTPMREPMRKINGLQFLRPSEIVAVRAINKLLVQRRKTGYRTDIINHIKYETMVEILPEDLFSVKTDRSSTINYILSSLSKTTLVTKYGFHRDFDAYKKNSYSTLLSIRNSDITLPYVYEFNPVIINKLVKLMSSIDFAYLGKSERTVVAGLCTHPNIDDWVAVKDIVVESQAALNTDLTTVINSATKKDVLDKILEIKKTKNIVFCRVTQYGKQVLESCRQISELLEKHNAQEISSETDIVEHATQAA